MPYRLALLSHGTGGVAAGLQWLGRRLAQAGCVAIGVDHHGNTGSEPYRAEGFLCLWERAQDLSALLADATWRERLVGPVEDTAIVAGFSAGAYAAMLLTGARVAYSQFEAANPSVSPVRGPREFPDLASAIHELLETSTVFRQSWERRTADYRDARVRAALVLAPGRSIRGFDPRSLAQIKTPVQIIGADADAVAPTSECSEWLHDRVSSSRLDLVGPGAGHYVFLPEPSPLGLTAAPDLFVDGPGVSRRAIHDLAALAAVRLFE